MNIFEINSEPRAASMSDLALSLDEANPYDAYAGFMDADSGIETEPPLVRGVNVFGPRPISMGDLSTGGPRKPRNAAKVQAFHGAYAAALDAGLSHEEAVQAGDKAVAAAGAGK